MNERISPVLLVPNRDKSKNQNYIFVQSISANCSQKKCTIPFRIHMTSIYKLKTITSPKEVPRRGENDDKILKHQLRIVMNWICNRH